MASLPLFVSPSSLSASLSSSLISHFLPKSSASASSQPAARHADAAADVAAIVADPSVGTSGGTSAVDAAAAAIRFSVAPRPAPVLTQPSLLPDEPAAAAALPRSLFDPFRSVRPATSARRTDSSLPLLRSLFDPLPPPKRESSHESLTNQRSGVVATMPAAVPPRAAAGPGVAHLALRSSPSAIPLERTEAALQEAGLAGQVWRGDALSAATLPSMPSGFRALDAELPGGGWPARCLTELLLSRTGVGEIRFLAPTLSRLTRSGRQIVLLAPPHVPDPTGWEQLGIDMRQVLVVRTPKPADRLWSIEQSMKSSAFGALLAWLPEEKTLARHDALRRLQSVAAAASGLSFLLRPAAAQYQASPAPLRLTLAAGRPQDERRTLSVRIIKRRGPVLAQPLALLLPEVHPGLRLFSLAAREERTASRSAGAQSDVASTFLPTISTPTTRAAAVSV